MTRLIKTIKEYRSWYEEQKLAQKSIGFVPTMGALHRGHEALMLQSLSENQITVASIFVNPTQFNDKNDLDKYPNTFEQDLALLKRTGVDALFYPNYKELYPDGYAYKIVEQSFSKLLCGASRPGHFDGVLTVVMKLLHIIKPNRAYFGEKDFQQYTLITDMARAFFLDTEIVMSPTVRDADGLALSSRNLRLTPEERKIAAHFPAVLHSGQPVDVIKTKLTEAGFTVDYIEDIGNRRYGAVYVGDVRLIDNIPLN